MTGHIGGEVAYQAVPRAERVMDDRLMTAERLLQLAGMWPLRMQYDERGIVLVCLACEGKIIELMSHEAVLRYRVMIHEVDQRGPLAVGARLLVQELLEAVLRHRVMIHDLPLSGRSQSSG